MCFHSLLFTPYLSLSGNTRKNQNDHHNNNSNNAKKRRKQLVYKQSMYELELKGNNQQKWEVIIYEG